MNVVDSSAWIEYVTDGDNAPNFFQVIEKPAQLLVPAITLLEVFKWLSRVSGERAALQIVSLMQQSQVVNLDSALALTAATLGIRHKLPLADSIIYATAQAVGAMVWTQDVDFEGLPGVKYFAKGA
jgi:predicted nucleic acid-binding protein